MVVDKSIVDEYLDHLIGQGMQVRSRRGFRRKLCSDLDADRTLADEWRKEIDRGRPWDCRRDGHKLGDLADERGSYCFACHVWIPPTPSEETG